MSSVMIPLPVKPLTEHQLILSNISILDLVS